MIEETGQEDAQLFQRFAKDRAAGFSLIYDRYSGPLLRFIYRFTGDRSAAEEIMHDVFAQLLDDRFKPGANLHLKAWLYTVARNGGLNHVRARRRFSEAPAAEMVDGRDLEHQTVEKDLLDRLNSAEQTLPLDLRETWRLRREGLDYREIADRLVIPIGTVKSRFARLVLLLKKEFIQ